MLVSLNNTETASATHDVELDHHCPTCNKTSPAWVRGKATVVQTRNAFEMGSSDAQFLAQTEAQRNAALLIRIARCPGCGARDAGELRTLWMRFVWAIVAIESLHAVVAMIASDRPFVDLYLSAIPQFGGLILGTFLVLGIKTWRDLHASDTRVRFIKEQSEKQGPYRSTQ